MSWDIRNFRAKFFYAPRQGFFMRNFLMQGVQCKGKNTLRKGDIFKGATFKCRGLGSGLAQRSQTSPGAPRRDTPCKGSKRRKISRVKGPKFKRRKGGRFTLASVLITVIT